MKKIIITLIFILIISSCYTKTVLYHSEASLPYHSFSSKTTFKFLGAIQNKFGVISAIDNDTLYYTLLCPAERFTSEITKLSNLNLIHSTPLIPSQAVKFSEILDSSITAWNIELNKEKGVHFEFYVAPENMIFQQSVNVVKWYPYLRYEFHNDIDGPRAIIILGDEYFKYIYDIDDISLLLELSKFIKESLNYK